MYSHIHPILTVIPAIALVFCLSAMNRKMDISSEDSKRTWLGGTYVLLALGIAGPISYFCLLFAWWSNLGYRWYHLLMIVINLVALWFAGLLVKIAWRSRGKK